MKTFKWLLIFSFVLCIVLAFVACGDDDDDSGDDDSLTDDDLSDDDVTDDDDGDDDVADDDAADDDTGDDDTDDIIADIDFEDYELGTLGSPWEGVLGGSTFTVVALPVKAGSGQGVEVVGSTALGQFGAMDYSLPDVSSDFVAEFDSYATPGSWAYFALCQHDDTTTVGFAHVERRGDDQHLYARVDSKTIEFTDCGLFADDTWGTITISIDYSASTYSVLLNDQPTPCADLPNLDPSTPFDVFELGDFIEADRGGTYYFDNLLIRYL